MQKPRSKFRKMGVLNIAKSIFSAAQQRSSIHLQPNPPAAVVFVVAAGGSLKAIKGNLL